MTSADRGSDISVAGGKGADRSATKVYLAGGGIASMAAAAFMIRIPGHNITIFEELDKLGWRRKSMRPVRPTRCESRHSTKSRAQTSSLLRSKTLREPKSDRAYVFSTVRRLMRRAAAIFLLGWPARTSA